MKTKLHNILLVLFSLVVIPLSRGSASAADTADSKTVHVKYAGDDTQLARLTNGTKFFIDKRDTTVKVPLSLRKMMFTRRPSDQFSDLTIDAPAGVKVFLIIANENASDDCRKAITAAGWDRADEFFTSKGTTYEVFSQVPAQAIHLTIPGTCRIVVAAEKLQVEPGDTKAKPADSQSPTVVELNGKIDQIRTGGGGHFLVLHLHDSNQLTVVDVLAGKVVKQIPAEGDICYCMDRDKLILVLNNQQVIQRWDLATLTREKTVMLPDDRPVKRAVMGSTGTGPLMMWTDGGCRMFDVGSLKPLIVNGTVQNSVGFGPWVSPDGLTVCDWGWSSGPYSLMRLSNLTPTSVDSKIVEISSEDFNESWAMPSANGTQLIRHGATIFDASTDELVALAPGPLKDSTVLPTEDPRFLLALRGENGNDDTSSVAILSAFDRRVLYTLRKTMAVTGGMIGTRSGRICTEPRAHYLPADNKLVLIPNSDDKVVIYPLDLTAALKATGADYLYVISKPHTVLQAGQKWDYQIQSLSSAGGVKYKLEEGPDELSISKDGRVTWTAHAPAVAGKVPVVITLSDASGQEITHAIELHIIEKPTQTPGAPAPSPRDATASAGKQPKSKNGAAANPPAK
jgi:hypothetical protein